MADDWWRGRLRNVYQVLKWNHAAAIGAYIELLHRLRRHSRLLISLYVNAVRAIVEIKIVHIGRRHVHLKRIRDLRERHAEAFGFFAIDAHEKLWIGRAIASE